MKTFAFEDGKYEYDVDEFGVVRAARRNGEPWPAGFEVVQYAKWFGAVLHRVEELESERDGFKALAEKNELEVKRLVGESARVNSLLEQRRNLRREVKNRIRREEHLLATMGRVRHRAGHLAPFHDVLFPDVKYGDVPAGVAMTGGNLVAEQAVKEQADRELARAKKVDELHAHGYRSSLSDSEWIGPNEPGADRCPIFFTLEAAYEHLELRKLREKLR